jgi:predicted CoA-binding protein
MASTDDAIRTVLKQTRTIAMIGASNSAGRPSHGVMAFLQSRGYRVLPVNPMVSGHTILGERVYGSLADVPAPFELVDIFRRADKAGEAVDEAISCRADAGIQAVWLQLGVIDDAAAERARAAGLTVVMDRCPAIEIKRLFGAASPLASNGSHPVP